MYEYKFFGKHIIHDNPNREYILGGVSKDENGIFGNGLYAILYFTKSLRGKIIPHHCEVYQVTTERNLVREQMIDVGLNWVGAEEYIRINRRKRNE